jgi:integrase
VMGSLQINHMKVASLKRDQKFEISALDFIHGKDFVHSAGQVVNFNDASWRISLIQGKKVTINFGNLPIWLIRPAKLTIATNWLLDGFSTSTLLARMTSFRWLAKWLAEFQGNSISELTSYHAALLQANLTNELTRYYETLESESLKRNKQISFRESKLICKESRLIGPKSIISLVSTFNAAALLIDEIDGLVVTFRLSNPREMADIEPKRLIGSADPNKVLTPERLAELESALGRDLKRYEKARALIDRELGNLDLNSIDKKRPNPIFDVERYFGLNGFREYTIFEIARLRGLSPSSEMNVTQLIKRFLRKRIGAALTSEIMKLRSGFHRLRLQQKFNEIMAARQYIHRVLAKADLSYQEPKSFCIERYFGLHGNRVHSRLEIARQLGITSGHSIEIHIRKGLFSLVGERKGRRLLSVRERLLYYFTRAIKAQALRLQIGVARRMSAVLEIPAVPRMKVQMLEARRVVEIQFRAGKMWGDEGLNEWVPCVDKFGEIAENAIHTTQRLTKDLRQVASKEIQERLFIIPDGSFGIATLLSTKTLHEYIYTNQKRKDLGILRRYGLEALSNFEFHHIRHTHSTHMVEEGGTIQDIARYLGHTTFNGSASIAGVFYLAGGTKVMRQRTAEALRRGAATGLQFDAIARMKIETMGEDAKKLPVPPNQLSFEEARNRLLSGDILDEVPVDAAEALRLMSKKIVFNVTLMGGCLLQANGGHCPTANPCPIGIISNKELPKLGCGCKHLVLLPHSVDQLSADLEIMEGQLSKMTSDEWSGWKSHIKAKIEHWRSLLKIAQSLNEPIRET